MKKHLRATAAAFAATALVLAGCADDGDTTDDTGVDDAGMDEGADDAGLDEGADDAGMEEEGMDEGAEEEGGA